MNLCLMKKTSTEEPTIQSTETIEQRSHSAPATSIGSLWLGSIDEQSRKIYAVEEYIPPIEKLTTKLSTQLNDAPF